MSRLSGALVILLALAGCATTEDHRFPLTFVGGMEVAGRRETALEALPAYHRMGDELARQGHPVEAAIAYKNAGQAALTLGRLQDAQLAARKAVEQAERGQRPMHLANCLLLLGYVHLPLNAPDKAVTILERAIRTAQQGHDPWLQASGYTWLSWAYRQLRKPEQALAASEKAADVLFGLTQQAPTWRGFSTGPEGQRRVQALDRQYATALIQLGWSGLALNQWDAARASFEKAVAIGQRIGHAGIMAEGKRGLGTAAAGQGNLQAAIPHLEEAIRLSPPPGSLAATQGTLGRIYYRLRRFPEAEGALRKAVAGIEDLRSLLQSEELRESFFEDKIWVYENLILCLLARGKGPEAFDISERARARAFLDLLGNRVTLSRGRSASLVAEEQVLRERISALKVLPEDSPALRRELELAREAYQAFLQRVRQMDREQASLMTVEPLTLREVQALLPEGSVLLEYFVTGQGRTILWTVERERVAVVTLPLGRQRVTERVQAFRELIASRERQPDMQRMAQALFNEFVRPGLQGRTPKELLIVPHDALHYLPFQALMPAPGRYLLQETTLHYYSSASLMQFTRAKGQAGAPTFFALGNPDFQDPTLSLRYAEREARGIAALFPETALVTGKAATKAASREEIRRHSVLHFATHAEFDETDPLGSALLLASTSGEESRLEVQEIFGLDLHASLVVLSACETALGKLTRGDELTGLTRAFIYAGTPSVITTLWQVNDRAAFELMREFYRHLKAGEGKAEALRQAQLAMLQRHPRPYYWAAYQLFGEAR
jgi:CHAT domain-containing protein/Tfp pilus assembly protein PilF